MLFFIIIQVTAGISSSVNGTSSNPVQSNATAAVISQPNQSDIQMHNPQIQQQQLPQPSPMSVDQNVYLKTGPNPPPPQQQQQYQHHSVAPPPMMFSVPNVSTVNNSSPVGTFSTSQFSSFPPSVPPHPATLGGTTTVPNFASNIPVTGLYFFFLLFFFNFLIYNT